MDQDKRIKFNLFVDGKAVRNLDELKKHFNVDDLLELHASGTLLRWLEVRGYLDEAAKVRGVMRDDGAVEKARRLSEIFQVDWSEEDVATRAWGASYNREREESLRRFRDLRGQRDAIVRAYHDGFKKLLTDLVEGKDDFARVKACVRTMSEDYLGLFQANVPLFIDWARENSPLTMFACLMVDATREWVERDPETMRIIDEAIPGTVTQKPKFILHLGNNPAFVIEGYRSAIEKMTRSNGWNFRLGPKKFSLSPDENSLGQLRNLDSEPTPRNPPLDAHIKRRVGGMKSYFADLVSRGRPVLLLRVTNSFAASASNYPDEYDAERVNGKFPRLDGLAYKSLNETGEILWMEIGDLPLNRLPPGIVEEVAAYVDALRPILYVCHADFSEVDELIRAVADGRPIEEFDHARGAVHFDTKAERVSCSLTEFLSFQGDRKRGFVVLKNVQGRLGEPQVLAHLIRFAERTRKAEGVELTVFVVSIRLEIPPEIEHLVTVVELPLPGHDGIRARIKAFAAAQGVEVEDGVAEELAVALRGLDMFAVEQVLRLIYQREGTLRVGDRDAILKEKRQIIRKTGRLEMLTIHETVDDIGGLEHLKTWLHRKGRVFRRIEEAVLKGVDVPRGVLLIGMPGCGKSLSAKVTASLFHVPLLRLDVGRLLGKYVGESEENMRVSLRVAEAVSPCVLWIDEIEKAFAGIGSDDGGGVATRLFGHFLTWMQEKKSPVFIVATANDVARLPTEFLRKGRFDEVFSVDLPNDGERRAILEVHLRQRRRWNSEIDTIALVGPTKGFNGADLEAAVKDAVETAFLDDRATLQTEDMLRAVEGLHGGFGAAFKDRVEKMKASMKALGVRAASVE